MESYRTFKKRRKYATGILVIKVDFELLIEIMQDTCISSYSKYLILIPLTRIIKNCITAY